MKKRVLIFIILLSANFANAQWSSNGPYGSEVLCNVQIGSNLYIGTPKGVFKSSNGGQTWSHHTSVSPDMLVVRLKFDGMGMYACLTTSLTKDLPRAGMYTSNDTGKTWTHVKAVIGTGFIYEMVLANNKVFIRNDIGCFGSSDQGKNWTKLAVTLGEAQKIMSAGNVLFRRPVLSKKPFLYRSTDDGKTWSVADSGMGGTIPYQILKVGNKIYAFNNNLVYTSDDEGIIWKKMTPAPTLIPNSTFAFWPSELVIYNGQKFYASIGGNTKVVVASIAPGEQQWSFITNNLPDGYSLSMFSYNTDVFICKEDELYLTTNNGNSWSLLNSGITGIEMLSVTAWGHDVFCGSAKRINYSDNNAQSWNSASISSNVYQVMDIYKFGSDLYASTSGSGVFKSTDNGKTWGTPKLTSTYGYRMTDDGTNVYLGCDDVVYKSTNGSTWGGFSAGIPSQSSIIDLTIIGSDIYACLGAGLGGAPGVYKSPLASAAWVIKSTGLSPMTPKCIEKIGNTLYVGVSKAGVFKSTDFAASWAPDSIGIGSLDVNDLIVSGSDLYAATDKGVWVLRKGASKWVNISSNLPQGSVNRIAANNDYLFAATTGASIWKTANLSAGIDKFKLSEMAFEVFPNPADGSFLIRHKSYSQGYSQVKIFDLAGKEIRKYEFNGTEMRIDISEFGSGIYIVQLSNGEKTALRKLIIQH